MLLGNCENLQCDHLIEACKVVCRSFSPHPVCSTMVLNKSFLNSVPLSVSSFLQTPNGKEIWFLHAVMTSSTDLFLIGIQNVKPVNIQTAVNAYLLPLDEGGWNSPMRSMHMNSIGHTPGSNICFSNCVFLNFLFCTCNKSFAMNQYVFPHSPPIVTPFNCSISPLVTIVTRLIVS